MTRIIKIRVVQTLDMEMIVGDEYPTGPLTPLQRKHLRDQIEADTKNTTAHQTGVKLVDVTVKRAFVANG